MSLKQMFSFYRNLDKIPYFTGRDSISYSVLSLFQHKKIYVSFQSKPRQKHKNKNLSTELIF